MITAHRHHDISVGHRVHGHESKCAHLHGHNYRIHFTIQAEALDTVGRVLDFSVIKECLCEWLEKNWDHKFLYWKDDSYMAPLLANAETDKWHSGSDKEANAVRDSFVAVPFNPTAENMAMYLVNTVAPLQLPKGVRLVSCKVEETRKCSATFSKVPL